ncbi:uncharacterized protein LOC143664073 [Tamandua tetradactyla]|uniref:uncharacterized protein LOC143664073 n=1 Tax=Tamandua tetradactyla TaxID=48850 RepID=UPI004053DBC1
MEIVLYPRSPGGPWTMSMNSTMWTIFCFLYFSCGMLLFLFLFLLHRNLLVEEGDNKQVLPQGHPEFSHVASKTFVHLPIILQKLLNTRAVKKADITICSEKEELFLTQQGHGCDVNSKTPGDLPALDQDTPAPTPFLNIAKQTQKIDEESTNIVQPTVPRPKSGDSPRTSQFGGSQFLSEEQLKLGSLVIDGCSTSPRLFGEHNKDQPHIEQNLQLKGEPQNQAPACANDGSPGPNTVNSKNSEPEAASVGGGDTASFKGPYIHLQDKGRGQGQDKYRDPKVQSPWRLQNSTVDANMGQEEHQGPPLGDTWRGWRVRAFPHHGDADHPGPHTEESTGTLTPQSLPPKGQGPHKSQGKRIRHIMQWICPLRRGNSYRLMQNPTGSTPVFQELRLCGTSPVPANEPVAPSGAHQPVPKVPGPPGRRRHCPLTCFLGCLSRPPS